MVDPGYPCFAVQKNFHKFKKILESWLGTPYKHLKMVKGRGADCTLYIAACWHEYGILEEITYDYYPRDWHVHTKNELVLENLFRHFKDHCAEGYTIQLYPPTEPFIQGDMLVFATSKTGVSNHTSIYLGADGTKDQMLIHSINYRGVSKFPYGKFWERKLTSICRVMQW